MKDFMLEKLQQTALMIQKTWNPEIGNITKDKEPPSQWQVNPK